MAIIINLRQPSRLCAARTPATVTPIPCPARFPGCKGHVLRRTDRAGIRIGQARYGQWGVDTDRALEILRGIPISLHCWQGDDVGGFENDAGLAGGGIQATGNYPGRARTADRAAPDLELALRLIPGRHRVNLHASYAEKPLPCASCGEGPGVRDGLADSASPSPQPSPIKGEGSISPLRPLRGEGPGG